jgi:hypothetical protein
MGAAYFRAAIPEPFRILGLRLEPLSLGRYLLLRRFGCAFICDDEATAGMPDLLLGLVICSMSVDEFLESARSGRMGKDIHRWGRRVCPQAWIGMLPFIGQWWRRTHMADAMEKMKLFKSYIKAGSEVPLYWDEDEGQRVSASHWSQGIEIALRRELGWSREEINEAPLTKALADYFKFAESQGLVRLMTEEEIRMIEEAERASAKSEIREPKSKGSNIQQGGNCGA